MSASPAGVPGRTPNGSGPPPPRRRPPPKVNPLNARHKPAKQIQRLRPMLTPSNRDKSIPLAPPPRDPRQLAARAPSPTDMRPPTSVRPVMATKRALLDGMRFHVARLISKEGVDVTDEKEYERPIKLLRKDPRYHANGEAIQMDSKEAMEDERERERLESLKLERQRVREEHQKQMAPAAVAKKKPQAFKKKVEQVYRADDTPEARKRSQLRYEEALPWHLADFTEKKIWQGAYEAALSECHVMLVKTDIGFRLVPIEKWYRFRPKATTKEHMDVETAEAQMAKGQRAPRWILKNEMRDKEAKKMEAAYSGYGLFSRSGEREERKGGDAMDVGDEPEVAADADDIDFDAKDEFADDEENELFEGDDDTKKLTEERLKREALNANIFDLNDEKEVDAEAERDKMLAEVAKRLEKSTKKALLKREKNFTYESDSEGNNPYSSESESEDSDAERAKEEDRKREEEQKAKQDPKAKPKDGTKPPSGSSSKGANTPSGRKEKHLDPHRKVTSGSLSHKRPGSPNLSEASGNESSRKRVKNNKGSSTPKPCSGDLSLPRRDPSRQSSFVGAAGSGSDTEAGRSRPRVTLKSKHGSPGASQRGSRAASPAAGASRAGSPPAPSQGPPTAAEIIAAIPDDGIPSVLLSQIFKKRIITSEDKTNFIAAVKSVSTLDKVKKRYYPKGHRPALKGLSEK